LRSQGLSVAARKPVQSFSPGELNTDAAQLGEATGEAPTIVCPPHRSYPLAYAPPMAADVLGRNSFSVCDLVTELHWPPSLDVGTVETVGGPRSPIAHDGDSVDLLHRLQPDLVLLVADAGLGTLNAVRLCLSAIQPLRVVVFLNRYRESDDLHRLNRKWLAERYGIETMVATEELSAVLVRS
jgi:dethiobiotin synthetase